MSANICRGLDKDRYDIHVCFLKEKGVIGERIESEGTRVHPIGRPASRGPDYFTSIRLRKLVSRHQFDIIHSHDAHSLMDGAFCRLTIPRLRFIHTFHFGNYPNRDRSFQRIERLVWRVPDKLIAVSDHQSLGLRELYGIPKARVSTVWNGVDILPKHEPIPQIREYKRQGRMVIGSVNTLTEQKGMPDLVEVADRLKGTDVPPFVFLIAGGGPMLDALRSAVDRRGLNNEVVFLDWIEKAPQSFLPYVDVFFQPSLWEAMSMVLLEAMGLGRAIVATAVGETPIIIDDEINGRLVAPEDVDSMAEQVRSFLLDDHLRTSMGESAMIKFRQKFTGSELAARHARLYSEVCQPNQTPAVSHGKQAR